MNVCLVGWKNLRRKKIRSALTITGVAMAVAVLVSLLGFDAGYQSALNSDVDKMGYQLLVTAKGCPYEAATMMLKGGGGLRSMEQSVYEKISGDNRVDMLTPQLVTVVYDKQKNGGQGGFWMHMGILRSYLELKPWMKLDSGSWFSGEDADEVIMGYQAAEARKVDVGDETFVPLSGTRLRVVGIFRRSGTEDDRILFMPLKTAQRIFKQQGKLTGVGIKLKQLSDMASFEEGLYNEPGIQVISLAQVKGTIFNLISSARAMTSSVALIAVIIAVFGVVNTILMSVFERTREIGVMKAIGASGFDVFRIIWTETTLICVLGGLFGNILAVLAAGGVEFVIRRLIPYAPSGPLVLLTPGIMILSFCGAVFLGLAAGVYPALKACAMKPVESLRWVE
jgi:putative ABC transport system permease protein